MDSGLMSWQTTNRSNFNVFEKRDNILKFHPLIDINSREQRELYIKNHLLPFHPLQSKGYFSVGCTHCTKPGKVEMEDGIIVQKQNVDYTFESLHINRAYNKYRSV